MTTRQAVWVTCVVDGADHAVSDADMSAGLAAGQGQYRAICGDEVVSAALTAPPGRGCVRCVAILCHATSRRPEVRSVVRARRGSHRRLGLRDRLKMRLSNATFVHPARSPRVSG
jgi:hypothetical protein